MRWSELGEERCSIARTVAIIGDRWTLLILRDCFLRVRRFEDFEARLGVTRHILADRLKKLVAEGVLRKVAYHERPVRYEYRLTQKGLDLPGADEPSALGRHLYNRESRPSLAAPASALWPPI